MSFIRGSLRKLPSWQSIESHWLIYLTGYEFLVVLGRVLRVYKSRKHGLTAKGRVPRNRLHQTFIIFRRQERLVRGLLGVTDDIQGLV
jgi:hypothetical protein